MSFTLLQWDWGGGGGGGGELSRMCLKPCFPACGKKKTQGPTFKLSQGISWMLYMPIFSRLTRNALPVIRFLLPVAFTWLSRLSDDPDIFQIFLTLGQLSKFAIKPAVYLFIIIIIFFFLGGGGSCFSVLRLFKGGLSFFSAAYGGGNPKVEFSKRKLKEIAPALPPPGCQSVNYGLLLSRNSSFSHANITVFAGWFCY